MMSPAVRAWTAHHAGWTPAWADGAAPGCSFVWPAHPTQATLTSEPWEALKCDASGPIRCTKRCCCALLLAGPPPLSDCTLTELG